jgi:hypothetical protein
VFSALTIVEIGASNWILGASWSRRNLTCERLIPQPAASHASAIKAASRLSVATEPNVIVAVARNACLPSYVDLLNINLDNHDLAEAKRRVGLFAGAFRRDGTRVTENLDLR